MNLIVAGQRIHYEVVGESRGASGCGAVVYLHGWGGSSRSLTPLADELSSSVQGYILDLPGFGRSQDPPSTWGVAEYAGCIKEFVTEAGLLQPISLVGHSFGGALALFMAAEYPELVDKLVVCAPSWHRHTTMLTAPRRLSRILHRFPLVRRVLYRALFPHSDMMKRPSLESNFKKIIREDLTDAVRQITQPTLIIWGKDDSYVPVTDATLLHEYIPQSTLRIYPGMKHDLPLTQSTHIAESIRVFLTTKTVG